MIVRHDADVPAPLDATLGLTPDDLRLLPERAIADAAGLVARHDGPAQALLLLDTLRGDGEESLTLADERTRLLVEAGRHAEAVAAARARLQRKESLLAQAELARALLNARDSDAAAGVAAAMLESGPAKILPHYIAGLAALARQRNGEARRHFERLLELNEDSPLGLRGLARVALANGDAGQALDLAGQALDRYAEAPDDLVRELQFYATRVDDAEAAALAQRRAAEALAALDASVRERLAQLREKARDHPKRARRGERAASDDAVEELPESGRIAALPQAPPPDPAAHDGLTAALRETFGYDAFREGQEEVISAVMSGLDTLAVMPTGAGKSLCYQLPAALRRGVTLVISPLIALMKDQVESLPPALLAQTTLINSSLETAELALRLGAIAAGRYRMVYAAPERLRQRPFIHALARAGVGLVVVDEAHCLSMWGHDFRPDYLFVREALPDLGDPQVLAMTATATPEMMAEIAARLGREPCGVNTGVLRDNLFLIARRADNEDHKLRLLLPFVQRQHGPGIVYVNSRENAEKLERQLRQAGISARAYHAGMGPAERTALQDRFMGGQVRVMVATVAFGMGVDKSDVRFIVHFNPARSLEAYSQESGRAGRDGAPAVCLLLHTPADRANLTRWSTEEAVDIAGLRAVYRALRALAGGGRGLVDAAALRERLEDEQQGAVDLRVAISMLENAGLLRRGPDVPRGATVTLRPAPDMLRPASGPDMLRPASAPDTPSPAPGADDAPSRDAGGSWPDFVRLARLEEGCPTTVDLTALARGLQLDVVALEDLLLRWQDEQRLTYRGLGRDMLIDLLPPPPDTAERMAAIMDGMGRRNRRRLRTLFLYLDTARCRHAFIARHFGHDAPDHCERCDVCRPVAIDELRPIGETATRVDDPAEAVRRLVGRLPHRLGRSGVAEVLKGATARRAYAERTELFGALAHLPKAAIERTIEAMLSDGELLMEEVDGYRMLRLADQPRDSGY